MRIFKQLKYELKIEFCMKQVHLLNHNQESLKLNISKNFITLLVVSNNLMIILESKFDIL